MLSWRPYPRRRIHQCVTLSWTGRFMTSRIHTLSIVTFVMASVGACGRQTATDAPEYKAAAQAAQAGFVAPLEDDSADEIMSWVDGQPVSDWASEIAKREKAIDGYLNDADAERAAKYGFRSGQHPRLAWEWFRN